MAISASQAQKRKAILEAALKVFDAHGYAWATVEDVAHEAKIAKGSIYNYFRSKEDLFLQVFVWAISGAETDLARIVDSPGSAQERIGNLLDYWFGRMGFFKRIRRLVLEFWSAAARQDQEGKLAEMFRQTYTRLRGLIGSILAYGVKAGEFRELDTSVAASLIMAMLDGIIVQSILNVGVQVDESFLAATKQSVLTGLKGKSPAAGGVGQ